jgi:hypothetical protein
MKPMADDLSRLLVENFLKSSWSCCIVPVVEKLTNWETENAGRPVFFFRFKNNQRVDSTFDRNHFFLRGSVEYSNPQVTLEEIQGIIAARMLEVCGNYFHEHGLHEPDGGDIAELCERLKKPPLGRIVAFLLNTDDIEPDRYSMNPLKHSIVASGQSAFPAANVKTDSLKVDTEFVNKYEGSLISKNEAELISAFLANSDGSYLDFSDSVKYAQLEKLSETFGMDLSLPALRMPLTTLQAEKKEGLLHNIISEVHRDFEAVREAYACMRRSITKRTTLMTVPHSRFGYGSKRAARGKLRFNENKLENVKVIYKTTKLYPNAIDPDDIAVAEAQDKFTVTGEKLADYSFAETPSSPQFFLYSLGSPENAALWHGVGAFAAPQLLQSYSSVRKVCREGRMVKGLQDYGVRMEVPMQLNLTPDCMWVHPTYRNIDASIGCVENLADLVHMGMKIEHLPKFK